MRHFVLPCLLIVLIITLACSRSQQAETDPSYATDVRPVFNTNCVSCHSGAAPAGSYDLSSRAGALGDGSDTVPNVVPGDAVSSLLYRRLDEGTMPPSGPLDLMDVTTVRNWIDKGAKDN